MSSTNKIILDTTVLEVRDLQGPDHRNIHEVHISYPNFQFRPGQFVMVKKNCGPTCWAYPYMIQQQTGQGFTVWAVGKSSLAAVKPEQGLTVWGANGRPVLADAGNTGAGKPLTAGISGPMVVCEAATWFLAAPIFNNIPGCRMLMLNPSGENGYLSGCDGVTFVRDVSQLAEAIVARLPEDPAPQIIAALNIPTLLTLVQETSVKVPPRLDTSRLLIFAGTKIGCGVDGCKSCYLHNKDLPLGMSVCCNGPYLPFDKVDFELDRRCFYTFD